MENRRILGFTGWYNPNDLLSVYASAGLRPALSDRKEG
jgi:hypothetical protein